MKRNFNKRKRFNNQISESIYIGFAFGIFIIFCIATMTSCKTKENEVKPITEENKKYIDGDIVENNKNIDTIINGLPCKNLELRNRFRVHYKNSPKHFKAITENTQENLYYIKQNWKNKDPRIKRIFNDTLDCFIVDTFFVLNSEYIYTSYLVAYGDVACTPSAGYSKGSVGGSYTSENNLDVNKKEIVFESINYTTVKFNYETQSLNVNDYRWKKESGAYGYDTARYKILK